jgi:hypothetical protein
MKPSIDFEQQLHTVPIRNRQAVVTESETSPATILVEVQLRYTGLLNPIAKWVNARKKKRYELVGLSREMFEKVDGKTNVSQLIDWLCDQEKLTFLEGRALVVQYLKDLMQRGLIVVLPEDAAAKINAPT